MKAVPPTTTNKNELIIKNIEENKNTNIKKKTVSIIGTCVSKDIFNELRLSKIFNVEVYAFKTCPFAMFDEPLNYPKEYIFNSSIAESQAVNIDYNINKTAIKALENKKSEYLFIDLYSIANDSIFEVEYNNKKTFMQLDQFKIVIDKFNNNNINILNYKNIPINKIDENIINFGLKKLAQWAEKNFKNIVIVWPVLAKQYLNINSKIINYSNKKLDELETSKKIINKYTEYLVSILPNAKILKYNDNFITRLYYYDFNNKNFEPNFVHLLTKNYEDIATNLLNLLKINYKDYYNEDLDYETLKIEKMKTDLEKLKAYSYNNIEHIYCHLVSYTNFINKLKNHIIVINGKGDIASKLRFYRNKNLIGTEKQNLKWNVLPNENYLAIIDTKNNFIYEKHSTDKIQYKYIIPNLKKEFSIESDKDKSSIIYDKKELSKDQLGLNFVIIDLNKNEVIDQAYCNISNDEYMLVTSKLFDKFNN